MESITCPGCQKPVRLPHDVLGQRAQCPFCKCHFRAPVRTPEGLTDPELIRRSPLANRLTVAGVVLLFVGTIGVFANGITAIQSVVAPDQFAAGTRQVFEGMAPEGESGDHIREQVPAYIVWRPRIAVASAVLSLVTLAGAAAILRRRGHGFAMASCFVTMLNVGNPINCCCFSGIFIGAWALSVVLSPTARAEFNAAPGAK